MASPSATNPSGSDASPSHAFPLGVRTRTVVSGRWVAAALTAALTLAVLVFFMLPEWLSAPRYAAPPVADPPPSPVAEQPGADTAQTVRQRLLAQEEAARYRAGSDTLRAQGAANWATQELAGADLAANEAASAVTAGDYPAAVEAYQEASRRLGEIRAQADAAYGRMLAEGEAAIQAGASAKAAQAFQFALMIRPEDARARQGLSRAEKLDGVLARHAAGESRELSGKLSEAREEYAAALVLDPEFAPAAAALKRVDGRLAALRFDQLMSRGLAQLEQSDWRNAEQSFSAALGLRAGERSAADGLAQAKEGLRRDELARLQQEARNLESAERWNDALAAYGRAAAIDPTVDFARQGIARSERMIALQGRIDAYLADPRRLYSPRVRDEAQRLLASLERERAGGPRLAQERQSLEAALQRATAKVVIQVTSDSATEVVLQRVGPLGRFQTREVTLTPGTYTLVGSRPGYKDVRVEVTVEPDAPAPRVFVACEEQV